MLLAFLSLLCSFLLFLTGWTVVTFFILGPLAIYLAWKSYKEVSERIHRGGSGSRLLALASLLIAIAAIPLTLMFINATYRA